MSVVDDEHKVYGLGADAFLTKPFASDRMIAEIIRLTSESLRPKGIDDRRQRGFAVSAPWNTPGLPV